MHLRRLDTIFVKDVVVILGKVPAALCWGFQTIAGRGSKRGPFARIFVAMVFVTEAMLEGATEVLGADVRTALPAVFASVPSHESAAHVATESAANVAGHLCPSGAQETRFESSSHQVEFFQQLFKEVGYLSIAVASGIRAVEAAKLGVLGGRASGKENGNAEKCARHVWKNKKKEQGWTVQQMTERDVGKARKNTSRSN